MAGRHADHTNELGMRGIREVARGTPPIMRRHLGVAAIAPTLLQLAHLRYAERTGWTRTLCVVQKLAARGTEIPLHQITDREGRFCVYHNDLPSGDFDFGILLKFKIAL